MIDKSLEVLRPNAKWTLTGMELSGLEWHDDISTRPTDDEINTKVAELEAAEPLRLLRVERNARITETDWWASSDLTMTAEQTAYRQALRDITNTYQSLDTVVWPTKP
jgi:hypothetical protein